MNFIKIKKIYEIRKICKIVIYGTNSERLR